MIRFYKTQFSLSIEFTKKYLNSLVKYWKNIDQNLMLNRLSFSQIGNLILNL